MAASRTINKEQSQTRTVRGVLDFESPRQIAALHYTGLSRFNKKDNVVILNLAEDKICTHPGVIEEMTRLRMPENTVQLSYTPVYMMSNDAVKVVFQNIGTLKKYLSIIKKDLNYTSADILAFAETRLPSSMKNDEIAIDGFQEVIRNDLLDRDGNGNAHHGTAIYVRIGFIVRSIEFHSTLSMEWSLLIIASPFRPSKHIQLAFIYVKPDCCKKMLKFNLNQLMTLMNKDTSYLVVGDFNINEYDYSNEVILQEISEITLSDQLVPQCTTEYNTKIDLAYGNVTSVGVISSMISYHSLITAQIDCKSEIIETHDKDILIYFLNGKSIEKCVTNVGEDQFLSNSHIVAFCGTNFNCDLDYDIPNFTSVIRKDGKNKIKHGLALYSKFDLHRLSTTSDDIILVQIKHSNDVDCSVYIVIVQRKANKSLENILEHLEPLLIETLNNSPCIIMADFKVTSNNDILRQYFHQYNFVQVITGIENEETPHLCFTNIKTYSSGVNEVCSLNRKAIWIQIPQNDKIEWVSV